MTDRRVRPQVFPKSVLRVIRGLRRLSIVDRVAILYVLWYVGWLAVRTPGTPDAIRIGTLAFLPLGLAVAWASWRNTRFPTLDRRTRVAWWLLAASALGLWFSGTAWAVYLLLQPATAALPWWVDGLELCQNACALAGYLAFPTQRLAAGRRARLLFDIGLTVIAGFVLAFFFGARSLTPSGTDVWETNPLNWAVDWLLFFAASIGYLQKRDATARGVMGILLAANASYLLANFALANVSNYSTGDTIDIMWFGAWVLRWGAARLAAYRYDAAERTGMPATDAKAPAHENPAFSYSMVAGAFVLLVVQIMHGQGRFLGLLAVSAVVMAALLVLRQLTELRENRRLFARQQQQDARFRLLIQRSSDIVLVMDRSGALTYVSPSAGRLYGTDCLLRVGARLHDLVGGEDRDVLAALVERREDDQRPFQALVDVAPGVRREVEIAWSDLRDDAIIDGIVLNCRDVTERNELERQLRHAQKLEGVGQLAGGLAHDFNNVLTAIRGYSELLRADLDDPARAREDVAHVEEAVDRAAAVTRKLLALSRNQPVERRPTDLNAVSRELLPLLRQLLTERVEVAISPEKGLWPVLADPGQIEQVLLNLATNARDAMPNGGRLRIATSNRTLSDRAAREIGVAPGQYAALSVADEGCGMTEEVRARIFEPFFSTKPRERGMGLGLAMVMGIVGDAGGGIEVQSEPGRGSTFTILLPRTFEAPSGKTPAAGQPAAVLGGAHLVMVVDDEDGVRTIVKRMLTRQGYRVIEAKSGEEAMEAAVDTTLPIELLLTDLVMPGLHGTELIAGFRQVRPGVPVVCMTGFAGEMLDPDGLQAGGVAILAKPFSSDALLKIVANALARAGASA